MNSRRRQFLADGFYFVASLVALALLTWMVVGAVQIYRVMHAAITVQEAGFQPGYLPANRDMTGWQESESGLAVHIDPAQTIPFLLGPLLLVVAGRLFDPSRGRGRLGRTAAGLVLLLYLCEAALLGFLLRFTWA